MEVPLPAFIEQLYRERFKNRPDVALPIDCARLAKQKSAAVAKPANTRDR